MSCLFCKCFEAVEPEQHRKEREARSCAFSCGNKWDQYTAAHYVKRHKRYLDGICHLNPRPELASCDYVCAKFEPGFTHTWVAPPLADENLREWARTAMQNHIYGDYREKEQARLSEENKALKAALQAARKRSASRLVKISKLERKSAKPPKPPSLRLIAAE